MKYKEERKFIKKKKTSCQVRGKKSEKEGKTIQKSENVMKE